MHALMIALVALCCTVASAKETAPGPTIPDVDAKPLGAPKPVTTTTIKRCPHGYELVVRANGRPGCAKDIVPTND